MIHDGVRCACFAIRSNAAWSLMLAHECLTPARSLAVNPRSVEDGVHEFVCGVEQDSHGVDLSQNPEPR